MSCFMPTRLAMRARNARKPVLKQVELFLNRVRFATAFLKPGWGQDLPRAALDLLLDKSEFGPSCLQVHFIYDGSIQKCRLVVV